MRIDVVDPSAFTPPYDHALCSALADLDVDVRLVTSEFAYGQTPESSSYTRYEHFYRRSFGTPGSRIRFAGKLGQHVPNMLTYRRQDRADVIHLQWLTVQPVDQMLLQVSGR